MGLFGFGKKKKTEEEIVAEGRDYYLNGDNKHAYLTLHGIAHKGQNAEACYYYGLVRLEGIRQPEVPANEEEGMKYIRKAAELGHAKAFEVYARMNMSEPAPASKAASAQEPASASKAAPVPEPVPAPAPAQKTDDDFYNEGVEAYGEKNYAIAVQTWLPLAEKGMAPAQESMGLLYYRGDGVEKDEKKAAEWYRKAAEQGRGRACFNLAIFYERGIGVEKDLAEALRWAEKAKEAGYEKSGDLIAEVRFWLEKEENQKKASDAQTDEELTSEEKYARGMELFRAGDYEGAFSMLRKVCRAIGAQKGKYPDGQAAMGWMYEHRQGVEAKDGMAQMHYRIAARNGDRDGMAGVVRLTAKAESPGVSECETALKYVNQLGTEEAKAFLNALEQKMAEAQKREAEETERKQREEELERTFDEGVKAYREKDYARAFYCFEKAAEQGSDAAQYNCGLLYEHGEGTAEDKAKALMWYEKAAEQGHSDAQFFAAVCTTREEEQWQIKSKPCTGLKRRRNREILPLNTVAAICTTRERVQR